ncbi:uncharacterized protein LOC116385801 [Anarrhichthys ocellatus]|uniref:uncharacterized protein LOC116385801 n=1 Tax=Anarrhichthys ocellatus TaxID=433405 RepID=UPI0012EDC372|nr:uncharacterized protein LOC116385801 [Anarrhichthys ocellatus]
MKLLLSSLILASFYACSSVSSPGRPAVTQSADVSVVEGETVNISCCWTPEFERLRVQWLENQTDMKEILYLKNLSHGSLPEETSDCSNLTITNVTREDSGGYICKVTVDIPVLTVVEGNGTVITVTARDNTKDNTAGGSHWEEVLIYVLRCLPILALIITFFFINSLVTKAQQHAPAAPGNERTPALRRGETQEEEERDAREIKPE